MPTEPRGDGAPAIEIVTVRFTSDHGLLKACAAPVEWRDAGEPCPEPEWRDPDERWPISHTLGEPVRLRLRVSAPPERRSTGPVTLRGESPLGLTFEATFELQPSGAAVVDMASTEVAPRKIQETSLTIRWSAAAPAVVTPDRVEVPAYFTLGPPRLAPRRRIEEEGVTLRRMATAVEWVARLDTLDPHEIVAGLMRRFPGYTLLPSPEVPDRYDHPTYFNDVGGAWPMAEYPEESGECQAIVRFIRGVLWQLGAPGEARVIVVWADPRVKGGREPLVADLEEEPRAGLDARKTVDGKHLVAALVDAPVEEGERYPPPHTRLPGGAVSPGLNRYEACLAFTHEGKTRYYCGGAGTFASMDRILNAFWGLVWVHMDGDEGFTVEEIVARYPAPEGT